MTANVSQLLAGTSATVRGTQCLIPETSGTLCMESLTLLWAEEQAFGDDELRVCYANEAQNSSQVGLQMLQRGSGRAGTIRPPPEIAMMTRFLPANPSGPVSES